MTKHKNQEFEPLLNEEEKHPKPQTWTGMIQAQQVAQSNSKYKDPIEENKARLSHYTQPNSFTQRLANAVKVMLGVD